MVVGMEKIVQFLASLVLVCLIYLNSQIGRADSVFADPEKANQMTAEKIQEDACWANGVIQADNSQIQKNLDFDRAMKAGKRPFISGASKEDIDYWMRTYDSKKLKETIKTAKNSRAASEKVLKELRDLYKKKTGKELQLSECPKDAPKS
jgi:hypothetical protein